MTQIVRAIWNLNRAEQKVENVFSMKISIFNCWRLFFRQNPINKFSFGGCRMLSHRQMPQWRLRLRFIFFRIPRDYLPFLAPSARRGPRPWVESRRSRKLKLSSLFLHLFSRLWRFFYLIFRHRPSLCLLLPKPGNEDIFITAIIIYSTSVLYFPVIECLRPQAISQWSWKCCERETERSCERSSTNFHCSTL